MYTADDWQRLHRAAMPVKTLGPAPHQPDANEPDSGVRHNPPEKYSIDSRNSKIAGEISIGVIPHRGIVIQGSRASFCSYKGEQP